jgi:anti-sigma B factor antagonist
MMNRKLDEMIEILEWDEDITLKNAEKFRKVMKEFVEGKAEYMILNMRNVKYINSAGLGIIADSVMTARKMHKELVIAELQESVKEIFQMVKFSSFIKLFATEKEAISYFKESEAEQKA